jgi:hypothetical protein
MGSHYPSALDIEDIAGKPQFTAFLDRVGFDRLTATLPGERTALSWFAVGVVVLEFGLLQIYNFVSGYSVVYVENPLVLVNPVLLVAAAVATESLHNRYNVAAAQSNLRDRAETPEVFEKLVPAKLTYLFVAFGIVFTLVNAVVFLTIPQMYAAGGPVRVFRFVVLTPFAYVPVLATFLATYIAVDVLLPRRLSEAGLEIDFLDPERLGGLRPIGELVKHAYYFLMLGLIGYAIGTYGPYILGGAFAYGEIGEPGIVVNAAFTAVWAASIALMAYGIYTMHLFMVREKREALHRLDEKSRDEIEDPWDIDRFDAADPPEEFLAHRERVNHITSTKEYPATFTMWTQILVGVLAPKAIQLLLAAL